jgi:hypothetical protein
MGLFRSGKHSFNEKYRSFSDAQKRVSVKQKQRARRLLRKLRPDADGIGKYDGVPLPRRKDLREKQRFSARFTARFQARTAGVRERLRRMRAAQEARVLGYIPMSLYIALCLATFGLYPYVWVWENVNAFLKVGGERIPDKSLRRFAVLGFAVQTLFPLGILLAIAAFFTGFPGIAVYAHMAFAAFVSLYAVFVLPLRCFHHFGLRWNIRGAVVAWDQEGVMIGRTMTSWAKLFFFGSAYIQHHINRLMGLGMPGFADPAEIGPTVSLTEWIADYVTVKRVDRAVAETERTAEESGGGDDG